MFWASYLLSELFCFPDLNHFTNPKQYAQLETQDILRQVKEETASPLECTAGALPLIQFKHRSGAYQLIFSTTDYWLFMERTRVKSKQYTLFKQNSNTSCHFPFYFALQISMNFCLPSVKFGLFYLHWLCTCSLRTSNPE